MGELAWCLIIIVHTDRAGATRIIFMRKANVSDPPGLRPRFIIKLLRSSAVGCRLEVCLVPAKD